MPLFPDLKSLSFLGFVVTLFCFLILGICQKLFPVLVWRVVLSDQRHEYHLSFHYYTVLFLPCTALFAKYPSYLSPRASNIYYYYMTNNRLLQLFPCTPCLLSFNESFENRFRLWLTAPIS